MSESPKLLYRSPIENYLDQIGHWLVMTTRRILRAVLSKRKVPYGVGGQVHRPAPASKCA